MKIEKKTEIKVFILILSVLIINCRTTISFEREVNKENRIAQNEYEEKLLQTKEEQYFIERQNLRPIVIKVTEPEIKKNEVKEKKVLVGRDALIENRKNSLIQAEYEEDHLVGWLYNEDSLYEIQTQTYHSTFIELEPGEQMLEEPYISEPDVWRLSRGVSYKNGLVTQHLVLKPDYANQDSTLIIVTDRRVYHLEIRSYRDRYMPIVRWVYPETIRDSNSWNDWMREKQSEKDMIEMSSDSKFISFDYKMNYSWFRTPYWLPKKVYDDGAKTYIILDERTLQTQMPVLFNERKNIINYRVNKNILIIDQLITKVTLGIGKEKVVIKKKKVSKAKAKKILENTQSEDLKKGDELKIDMPKADIKIEPISPRKRDDKKKDVVEDKKNDFLPGTEEAINAAKNGSVIYE